MYALRCSTRLSICDELERRVKHRTVYRLRIRLMMDGARKKTLPPLRPLDRPISRYLTLQVAQ